jgi:hypothetical protein
MVTDEEFERLRRQVLVLQGFINIINNGTGQLDHSALANLLWVNSGHQGTSNQIAAFNGGINGTPCLILFDGNIDSDTVPFTLDTRITPTIKAATDPGAGDDQTTGQHVGSIWLNQTGPKWWICSSAATGSAVWNKFFG